MSVEQAKKNNYNYKMIEVDVYYKHSKALPDAKNIKSTFIFENESGLLLGTQLIGGIQVAEIIHVIGLAIQEKNTAPQLFSKAYGTPPLATPSLNHCILYMR